MAVHSTERARPSASQRDPEELRTDFERWLSARQSGAAVATAEIPASTGMSSETILIDAGWDGEAHRLVVRVAAQAHVKVPFAHPDTGQDMRYQFLTLRRLGSQIIRAVVPQVLWCEDDPSPMGAPFLVMSRVDGQSPAGEDYPSPDVVPYNIDSWVSRAGAADRDRMQHATLEQLARVHAAAPLDFAFLDRRRPGESALSAHFRRTDEYYARIRGEGVRVPLIERGLAWLRDHWPAESEPVVCWGDARIGNIVYRDFSPVALLGWETATLGPRELDLGQMIFFHRFVEELADSAGLSGLPDFLRRDDVAAGYADLTGYRPSDLDFYTTYAAVAHALKMVRIRLLAAASGQEGPPADADAMVTHRDTLAAMLDGTYWSALDPRMTGGR
ncbi:MAG: phosphotransferase family protein [Mycobacteriaceae bacterium]|nr:phosphotransferase family protein [Mycobacteriaceae bacterium]